MSAKKKQPEAITEILIKEYQTQNSKRRKNGAKLTKTDKLEIQELKKLAEKRKNKGNSKHKKKIKILLRKIWKF